MPASAKRISVVLGCLLATGCEFEVHSSLGGDGEATAGQEQATASNKAESSKGGDQARPDFGETRGQAELGNAPRSVVPGDTEGENILMFQERDDYSLPADLTIEAREPGTYDDKSSLQPYTLRKGSVVDSFYVHMDIPGDGPEKKRGTVEFDREILGVVASDQGMVQANEILDVSSLPTKYPKSTGDDFGLRMNGPDGFEIGPDRRSITIDVKTWGQSDSLRVFLAAGEGAAGTQPAPAADRGEQAGSSTGVRKSSGHAKVQPAPRSVVPGEMESEDIVMFQERDDYELPRDLTVEAWDAGTYKDGASLQDHTIRAGTKVDTFYVHVDIPGSGPKNKKGTVEFDREILGVVATDQAMVEANEVMDVTSLPTEYPESTAENFGLRMTAADGFEIGPDRRSITVDVKTWGKSDSMRVVLPAGGD